MRKRILVLYEPGRAGDAAVELGAQLAREEREEFTVVRVAPQAPSGSRCGGSAREFNEIVREDAARDLDRARELVWAVGARAEFELLADGSDPSLAAFAAAGGYELILLPARRGLLRPRWRHARRRSAASPAPRFGSSIAQRPPALDDPDRDPDRRAQEHRPPVRRVYHQTDRDSEHREPDRRPEVAPIAPHDAAPPSSAEIRF